ncbi:MAG: hypothetical protein RMJ00_02220 [Nitrososphaerota archaeon]|nr:hypothetical protein [Candidatus Bathyarchaeota archaeon]MCX8161614.1 hypothetical protein [Candidatus Bathyarchaeota archaeon]MDW8061496.1 hypothetical protein [Nitrososphaerota archaeon]
MAEDKLYVHIEYGDLKADFTGSADEVLRSIVRFLSKILPSLRIVEELIYKPSLEGLAEALKDIVKVSEGVPMLSTQTNFATHSLVLIGLAAKYLSFNIGLSEDECMDARELSIFTGKSEKTVRNILPKLLEKGLITRTEKGRYAITILGLKKVEEEIVGRVSQ